MLKLFARNTVVQVIVILAVTALLWAQAFADPQPMTPSGHFSPLYDLLCSIAPTPTLATAIAMILVVSGGFFFNLILAQARLVSQNSLLPTLLFIVIMSAGTPALSPSLLAALLTISILNMLLLRSTLLAVSTDKIFGTAALIGIASMLYLPSITLVAAYLLVAVNYRLYGWREWMVFLLGLLAPYLLLWSVQLFTDSLVPGFRQMGEDFSNISLTVGDSTTLQAIANIVLLTAFAVSLFVLWSRLREKPIVWQKNATTIMLLTVSAVVMLPFSQLFPVDLKFFALPFTFCLCQRLSLPRRTSRPGRSSWRSLLFDLLFILIIVAAILC